LEDFVESYISETDPDTRENANFDRSFSGLESFVVHKFLRNYILETFYPKNIRDLFLAGGIHIHNLSQGLIPYCFGANLELLLRKGLHTPRVITKPARHLSSAVDHIVNYLCTSQQEFAGAQAISDVNYLLAPFIAKDSLSYRKIKQCVQRLIFNLNFPSRSGYQTPFTNFVMDMACPSYLKDREAFVGYEALNAYSEYQEEALLFLEVFNEIMFEGDAKNQVFTFPIPTINIKPEDREFLSSKLFLDLIRTDLKYGIYYFFNYIGSGIQIGSKRAMCCRLILDLEDLPLTPSGRWAYESGTGSLGVVSLNLPRIGFLSKGDDDIFFEILDLYLELAKRALMIKGQLVEKSLEQGLLPLSLKYGVNFDRFFRTIGIIGLNEMCLNFSGEPLSEEITFSRKVLLYLREYCKDVSRETGYIFNLEMTPGEGSAFRMALLDRKRYPDIITLGTKERPYYSTLLTPPSQNLGIIERLRIEEKLLPLFTGGTIHRIFLGEAYPSVEAMARFISKVIQFTKIPYLDLSNIYSICPNCGKYCGGEVEICSDCQTRMLIYSRIVGFYRPLNRTNPGKYQEIKDRIYKKTYSVCEQ